MRKKLMIPALLLGMIFLGSCVKETESQSVTDIRDAKAEQLKARADLNNAAAEATKIAAAAEVALMEAKAQAQAAQTALYKAETETIKKKQELTALKLEAAKIENEAQKIENQKAQLELEKALFDLEITKKTTEQQLADIALQLEVMKAENKAALVQAQADVVAAQKALLDYQKGLADAENSAEKDAVKNMLTDLTAVSDKYVRVLGQLNAAEATLLDAQTTLVELETELVDFKEAKEKTIAYNNNRIAEYESYIAIYKEFENYNEDVETVKDNYTELSAQKDYLYVDYITKENKTQQVLNEYYDEEYTPGIMRNSEIAKADDSIANDPFMLYLSSGIIVPEQELEDGTTIPAVTVSDLDDMAERYVGHPVYIMNDNSWPSEMTFEDVQYTLSEMFFYYGMQGTTSFKPYELVDESGNHSEDIYSQADSLYFMLEDTPDRMGFYTMYTAMGRTHDLVVENVIKEVKDSIASYKELAQDKLDELQANYDGEATGYYQVDQIRISWMEIEYELNTTEIPFGPDDDELNAVEKVEDAKAAYDKAKSKFEKDPTSDNEYAMYEAQDAYVAAMQYADLLKAEIDGYAEVFAAIDADSALFDIFADFYKNDKKHFENIAKLYDARNAVAVKENEAYIKAKATELLAEWAYDDMEVLLDAMYNYIYTGTYSADALAVIIKDYEEDIADLKEQNADLSEIESKEELIELQKLRVEMYDINVKALEEEVAAAKEALDALLAELK